MHFTGKGLEAIKFIGCLSEITANNLSITACQVTELVKLFSVSTGFKSNLLEFLQMVKHIQGEEYRTFDLTSENISSLGKKIPKKDKFLEKIKELNEIYSLFEKYDRNQLTYWLRDNIRSNLLDIKRLIPIPIRYTVENQVIEEFKMAYELDLIGHTWKYDIIDYSEVVQKHEVFVPDLIFNPIENAKMFLIKKIVGNDIPHLIELNKIPCQILQYQKLIRKISKNKNIRIIPDREIHFGSFYISNLTKEINITDSEFSEINVNNDLLETAKEINFLVHEIFQPTLGEFCERDYYTSKWKSKFFNIDFDGIQINRENYYAYPPIYEMNINISNTEKSQNFKSIRDLKWDLSDCISVFQDDYLISQGYTDIEYHGLITLNILRKNKLLTKYLNVYLGYQHQEVSSTIDVIKSFSQVNSDIFYVLAISIILNIAETQHNWIHQRLICLDREFSDLKKKSNKEQITEIYEGNKMLWQIINIFKNILFVRTKEQSYSLLNFISIKNLELFPDSKNLSIEQLLAKRQKTFQSKSTIKPSDLIRYSIEYDLLHVLEESYQGKCDLVLNLPSNMLSELYPYEEATIRDIYSMVHFDFNSDGYFPAGPDFFVTFLANKIGYNRTFDLIKNEPEKYQEKLKSRLIKRNMKKFVDKFEKYCENTKNIEKGEFKIEKADLNKG